MFRDGYISNTRRALSWHPADETHRKPDQDHISISHVERGLRQGRCISQADIIRVRNLRGGQWRSCLPQGLRSGFYNLQIADIIGAIFQRSTRIEQAVSAFSH